MSKREVISIAKGSIRDSFFDQCLQKSMSIVFTRYGLGEYTLKQLPNGNRTVNFKSEKDRFIYNLHGKAKMYHKVVEELHNHWPVKKQKV
jgi:hypothetical protein